MATDIGDSLRAEVARGAGHRCEYCLIHEEDAGFPHQVDHIVSRRVPVDDQDVVPGSERLMGGL